MPTGTLYVVATPIGNLEDITIRAVRVLRQVDLIAAEDTRRTARLLQHYGIRTATVSLHAHNERRRSAELLGRLCDGRSVALVSDAGTPLISDPGLELVRSARAAGVTVTAVPGPSAIATILSAAGVPADRFVFAGFPPRRSSDRIAWLKETVLGAKVPVVVFEAPHRVGQFLSDALLILGNRPIVIGRELTKVHEELVDCPIADALSAVTPRGEFTILFPAAQAAAVEAAGMPDPAGLRKEVGELTESGQISLRKAAAIVAERYGLKTNAVYRIVSG